ncbi:MAG TPA: alpha/beta family hydrolase [Terracidiphilus sp.]
MTAASTRLGFQRAVDLRGRAGRIEALLNEGSDRASFAALVCHPHPLGGGTMHNKVVYHTMKVFNGPEWGFRAPVLRFNFRGTGLSEGRHDGAAEAEDVAAALDWLESEFHLPVVAAGFSFGAAMTLCACCRNGEVRKNVHRLALLGLPTDAAGRDYSYSFLDACAIPKLFLSGDRDQYAPAKHLEELANKAAEPKRLVLVRDADHFFSGRIEKMQQALAAWLKEQTQ